MARIRTVKPDYPQHRKTRSVSRDARLLNIHLWNLADDEGRLQELPQWIIGAIFPADEDVTTVALREWLQELSSSGLIHRYELGEERYIQCHDFTDHQTINKPRKSELPSLAEAESNGSVLTTVALPEASSLERKGKERKGKEEKHKGGVGGGKEFEDWLTHYRSVTNRTKVEGTKSARSAFAARRKEGRGLEDLKLATVGCRSDAWFRERTLDTPDMILRSDKIERFVEMGQAVEAKPTSPYAGHAKVFEVDD